MDVDGLLRLRADKDAFFARDPDSPLTLEQRSSFRGLPYFPLNAGLVVEAVLDTKVVPGDFWLQTNKGDAEPYRRVARARFVVGGQAVALTLFATRHQDDLFVPFRDTTSGVQTYAAGRYLEAVPLANGGALLDFNRAYNPYCAYNDRWRCPVPSPENHLPVQILAGERAY